MDFKCVSVGSRKGSVMEKITSNEHFRDMKKQLHGAGKRKERLSIRKKKKKRKVDCQIISTLMGFRSSKKKIKF